MSPVCHPELTVSANLLDYENFNMIKMTTHDDFWRPTPNRTELQGFVVLAAAKLPAGIMAPFASLIPNPIAILSHLEGGTACILDDYRVRVPMCYSTQRTQTIQNIRSKVRRENLGKGTRVLN